MTINQILEHRRQLGPSGVLLLLVLVDIAQGEPVELFLGELGEIAGLSTETMTKLIKRLVRLGLIEYQKGNRVTRPVIKIIG